MVSGQSGILGLALSGDTLFWTNQQAGQVRRCLIDDCTATAETVADSQQAPTNVAVDDDGVYWTSFGFVTGWVAGCPLAGCPEDGPRRSPGGQLHPIAIEVDDTHIYWTNVGDPEAGFSGGGVYAVPK